MSATPDSWKCIAFTQGEPINYTATFSRLEFAKLCEGLVPEAMEDEWFIYYDEPHLFFHRSWTGLPAYRVALAPRGDAFIVTEALLADNLANEAEIDRAHQVQMLDFVVSNLLLGQNKPFPMPEALSNSPP